MSTTLSFTVWFREGHPRVGLDAYSEVYAEGPPFTPFWLDVCWPGDGLPSEGSLLRSDCQVAGRSAIWRRGGRIRAGKHGNEL